MWGMIERCENSPTIEKIGDGLNRTPDRRARPEWRIFLPFPAKGSRIR
jgi:hypothetical protein